MAWKAEMWERVGAGDGLGSSLVGAVRVKVERVMGREAGAAKAADRRSRDERAADAMVDFGGW